MGARQQLKQGRVCERLKRRQVLYIFLIAILKMEYDTKTPLSSTSDKSSFAYISARDRWPVILTGAIDDVHKAVSQTTDVAKRTEGKKIVEELAKLKYELQHDRKLT